MEDNPFANDFEGSERFPEIDEHNIIHEFDRMEELERLKRKRDELLEKNSRLQKTDTSPITANWPSFYPLLKYDLENDIPKSARSSVSFSFKALLCFAIRTITNIFSVIFVSGVKDYPKGRALIFAILTGLGGIYVMYRFSFQWLYVSCMKHDIPISYSFAQFLIIIYQIYLTIGFPSSGSVGLATLLDVLAMSHSWFSILIGVINTAIIALVVVFSIISIGAAQKYQKVSGVEAQTNSP